MGSSNRRCCFKKTKTIIRVVFIKRNMSKQNQQENILLIVYDRRTYFHGRPPPSFFSLSYFNPTYYPYFGFHGFYFEISRMLRINNDKSKKKRRRNERIYDVHKHNFRL